MVTEGRHDEMGRHARSVRDDVRAMRSGLRLLIVCVGFLIGVAIGTLITLVVTGGS